MSFDECSDDLVYNVIRKLRDNKFIDLFEIGRWEQVYIEMFGEVYIDFF